ncbi:MAG: hypothetical protein AAF583_00440 [Pseudomonadota bacterium]
MSIFFLGAIVIVIAFILSVWQKWIPKYWIWLFFVAFLLGSTWEFGFTALEMTYESEPGGTLLEGARTKSTNGHIDLDSGFLVGLYGVAIFSIWDAGIFLIGAILVWLIMRRPPFQTFNWSELTILLGWGQFQCFAIEFSAISEGYWAYWATFWNPELFPYQNGSITLWPQLVWVIAYLVFYACALRISKAAEVG